MKTRIFVVSLVMIGLIIPTEAHAQKFNPNFIISDRDMFDSQSFSRTAIQRFLEQKKSVLAGLSDVFEGMSLPISEIIWKAGINNTISPKFLLTKLQHEQGLIERSTASQKALDWATGYSCYNRTCNEKYKGIAKQIDAAATSFRIYTENPGRFKFRINQATTTTDGIRVEPQNQATANLYIYTPYAGSDSGIGGNFAFWRVWNRYFGKQKYPDGTILKDPENNYWRITQGERRKYLSLSILLSSRKIEEAVDIDSDTLKAYIEGPSIRFANYSIVQSPSSELYLIVDDTKRLIVSQEAFRQVGFNPEEIIQVQHEEIVDFRNGPTIDESTPYPTGALTRNPQTGEMFFVQNGIKYPLIDELIAKINYPNQQFIAIPDQDLQHFPIGASHLLRDGALIKSPDNTVYLISEGKKLRIANDYTFTTIFGAQKINQITQVSQAIIDLHPEGDVIEFAENIPDETPPLPKPQTEYRTVWDDTIAPTTLAPKKQASITIEYINNGTAVWKQDTVKLAITDEGDAATDFYHPSWPDKTGKILMKQQTVAQKNKATFSFLIQAPTKPGAYTLIARLKQMTDESGPSNIAGGLVTIPITVPATNTATILKNTTPKKISNLKTRYPVSLTIKNTGKSVWTRKRLALIIENENGSESAFYDPNDWLSSSVAAVPLSPKSTTIKPGQSAVFTFTLKSYRIKKGGYSLRFKIIQKDTGEMVYIKGNDSWTQTIQVVGK